jgi:hypothetical protein
MPKSMIIDPAAGTGRFLVDLAVRYPNRSIALLGVEGNLDLYRAGLVNMRVYAWNRPYFVRFAHSTQDKVLGAVGGR